MLTLKEWSLVKFFQYIPEYFRCPAVARGPPTIVGPLLISHPLHNSLLFRDFSGRAVARSVCESLSSGFLKQDTKMIVVKEPADLLKTFMEQSETSCIQASTTTGQ